MYKTQLPLTMSFRFYREVDGQKTRQKPELQCLGQFRIHKDLRHETDTIESGMVIMMRSVCLRVGEQATPLALCCSVIFAQGSREMREKLHEQGMVETRDSHKATRRQISDDHQGHLS